MTAERSARMFHSVMASYTMMSTVLLIPMFLHKTKVAGRISPPPPSVQGKQGTGEASHALRLEGPLV